MISYIDIISKKGLSLIHNDSMREYKFTFLVDSHSKLPLEVSLALLSDLSCLIVMFNYFIL